MARAYQGIGCSKWGGDTGGLRGTYAKYVPFMGWNPVGKNSVKTSFVEQGFMMLLVRDASTSLVQDLFSARESPLKCHVS